MKLSEQQIAEIICGAQDDCIHRKINGGGQCGDCACPARVIYRLETDGDLEDEDMDSALEGNHLAQHIVKLRS